MSLIKRDAFNSVINNTTKSKHSVYKKEDEFACVVMSSPAPYSGPATATQDPETLNRTGVDSKYIFTARMTDPNTPHQKFLENPCDEATSPDIGAGSRLYALHAKVRLSHAGAMPKFQPGDIIKSEMLAGGINNLYDLQFCDMSGIQDVFQNQQISKAGACAKLGNLFGSSGGGGAGGGGFVGNVAGMPLTASDELKQTEDEPKLIKILRKKGYVVYDDGTINTIGVRSENRVPDKFDDIMHLIWKKDGLWNDIAFQITTDPGLSIVNRTANPKFLNSKGAAQLKEGQYVDAYKAGMHGSKPGMEQRGEVTVYRDNNANNVLDWESSGGGEETGRFGINIHRAGINSQQVGAWSAGCQVFQKNDDFEKAWGIWKSTGQERFTYTLLLWSDLTSAVAFDASAYNESNRGKTWEWVDEAQGHWKYIDETTGEWVTVTG